MRSLFLSSSGWIRGLRSFYPQYASVLHKILSTATLIYIVLYIRNMRNRKVSPKHLPSTIATIVFLLHLATSATCLATKSLINDNTADKGGNNKHKTIVISTQRNGGNSLIFPSDSSSLQQKTTFQIKNIGQNIKSAIQSTFMPSGYPNKTPSGYLRYSIWSWIQDISTQLRSVLATQRILEGVGVGREGATALSALMNYLTRDGCGMAATLLFTSIASSRFRTDVKRWRLFADLMVDLGITLEVAAVASTKLFLPMICLGSACKAVCGVAAGACGGAINLFWARGSDISDINAKFGAQHTVTGAFGLVFAALFARSVSTWKLRNLWILYIGLTIIHILANVRCMRLIAFNNLNQVRMNIVLAEFLQWWDQQTDLSALSATTCVSPAVSSPSNVTNTEPLFFLPAFLTSKVHALQRSSVPLYFGCSFNCFSEMSQFTSGSEITESLVHAPGESSLIDSVLGKERYLISAGIRDAHRLKSGKEFSVCVVFRSSATPEDEAKAYLHSLLLGRRLKASDGRSLTNSYGIVAIEREMQNKMSVAWPTFQTACNVAGWDLTKTELRTLGYEMALSVL